MEYPAIPTEEPEPAAALTYACGRCRHVGFSHDNWAACAECGCPGYVDLNTLQRQGINLDRAWAPDAYDWHFAARCGQCSRRLTAVINGGRLEAGVLELLKASQPVSISVIHGHKHRFGLDAAAP